MPGSRNTLLLLLATALLGACGAAETTARPASAAPAPGGTPPLLGEPTPQSPPEPEPPAPEPSARERWDEPFAVQSSGGTAPRPPRSVAVADLDAAPVEPAPAEAQPAPTPAPAPRAEAPAREPAPAPERATGSRVAALRAAAAARAEREAEEAREHRVERGDTWYGIARRYGVAPAALRTANPGVDPERIRIGQTLRIPREESAGREASARTHRVERGDSLWGIARRYGVSMDALRRANRLQGDRVRIGQTLLIPEEGR